jgi:hypothetical protein
MSVFLQQLFRSPIQCLPCCAGIALELIGIVPIGSWIASTSATSRRPATVRGSISRTMYQTALHSSLAPADFGIHDKLRDQTAPPHR